MKTKIEYRKEYINIRRNINNRETSNEIIYQKVINNEQVKNSHTILCYLSYNYEVDTIKIINYFLGKKQIALPKIEGENIDFYYINSLSELSPGKYGILEPTSRNKVEKFNNTICLIPGVCFSTNKYRIGYGGGFYDKFLSKHPLYSIGLCYKACLVSKLPINKYDQKVNEIITE